MAVFEEYLENTLDRCRKFDQKIFAFSKHEKEYIARHVPNRQSEITSRYVDVNVIVKGFFRQNHTSIFNRLLKLAKDEKRRIGLKDYLNVKVVKYDYPLHLKLFKGPANALMRLRQQLAIKYDYAQLSPGAKRAWTNLISYNYHDCAGMMHLLHYIHTY